MQNYGRERHRDSVEQPSPVSDHRDKSAKNDILASLKNFGKNKDKQAVRETAKRENIDETFRRIDTLYQQLGGQHSEHNQNSIVRQEQSSQKSVKSKDIKARQQVVINRIEALTIQRDLRGQASFSRADGPYDIAEPLRNNGVRRQSDHILQNDLAEIYQQIEVLKQDENRRRVDKDATRPEATMSGAERRVDQSSASRGGVDLPVRKTEKSKSDKAAVNIETKIYNARGKREKENSKRNGLDNLVFRADNEAYNLREIDPVPTENVQSAQTQRKQILHKEIKSSKDIRQELDDVRDQLQKLRVERNEERDNARKELDTFQTKEQAFRSIESDYQSIESTYQNKIENSNLDERISQDQFALSVIKIEKERRLQFERASAGVGHKNPRELEQTDYYQRAFPMKPEQDSRSDTYQSSNNTHSEIDEYRQEAEINAYRQEMEPRRNTDSQRFNDQSRRSEVNRQEDFAGQGHRYLDSIREKFINEAQSERAQNLSHLNNRWHALINDRGTFDENTSKNIHNAEQAINQLEMQKNTYLSRREEFKADWRSRRDQQLNRLEQVRKAENERRNRRDQRYGEHAQQPGPARRMSID